MAAAHVIFFVLLVLSRNVNGQILLSEVSLHAANNDCWTAVYGSVYDVSDYAALHPSPKGAEDIWAMCGIDATDLYDAEHGDNPEYLDIFPGIILLGTLDEFEETELSVNGMLLNNSTNVTSPANASKLGSSVYRDSKSKLEDMERGFGFP
ncbi:Cytochrome b5 reductase 4 [Seminavis robusta]|uniref:Cytochrome b5 reductase 4 n=1 Tax=Seminavis robusta TaxID=568900 RepID=A0A9N8EET8_9STRA|nr:Cytochrome b5 reductase 4 [Seminavis robusta]|eukprot:Sro837_g209170.1 Cytochrome b5 reductase 4 (151) ;mRNA; r:28534-29326